MSRLLIGLLVGLGLSLVGTGAGWARSVWILEWHFDGVRSEVFYNYDQCNRKAHELEGKGIYVSRWCILEWRP